MNNPETILERIGKEFAIKRIKNFILLIEANLDKDLESVQVSDLWKLEAFIKETFGIKVERQGYIQKQD